MGDDMLTLNKSVKLPPGYTEIVISSDGAVKSVEYKKSDIKLFHWECWLRKSSGAKWVKLSLGGIIAGYDSPELADKEKGADKPWPKGKEFECWIRKTSKAKEVKFADGGIIGVYESEQDAKTEKEKDEPWQKWVP